MQSTVITDSLYLTNNNDSSFQFSSSCVKLVYVLVLSRSRRDPCFGLCVAALRARRPNYGNRALMSERSAERSDPKIGWSGAER